MKKSLLLLFTLALLAGCGTSAPSIAGTWVNGEKDSLLTLTIKEDHTWDLKAPMTTMSGTWTLQEKDLTMKYTKIGALDVAEYLKNAGHGSMDKVNQKNLDIVKNGAHATLTSDTTLVTQSPTPEGKGITFTKK